MKPAVLTIRRADLVRENACAAWLSLFDAVCQERDTDRATGVRVERGPLVRRRDGSSFRNATRLRIELTPLAQMWLALPIDGGGSAWSWLRAKGAVGAVSAPEADLCGANLRGANLRGASLREANLRGASLREANLYGADLRGADLRGASLREANLRGASLREANLREANLYGADLRGADLRGASLRGADLCGANLRGADLCGADRSGDDAVIAGWRVVDGRMERAS